jgi:hypothetical protein
MTGRVWHADAAEKSKTAGIQWMRSIDFAVEDGGDLADFADEFGEFSGEDGLHAVGEGLVGGVMNFDKQAVGAYSYCGAGEGQNFMALAGAVAGVDEDRQVAAFFYRGDDGQV